MGPRRSLHLEPHHLDLTERLAPDDRLDVQIQATAVAENALDRVEPWLPRRDHRVSAEPVLQEDEPTARPEHPVDFVQRPPDLGDAAQGPGLGSTVVILRTCSG